MEFIIDAEFRDLIPPLTEEEYQGLEKNLLENGFNPAFPILVWKGHNIIVDGHNRYSICVKHNLPFEHVEQEFASRYDVINEMFKIQFDRRNMSSRTKTYLVGRRYLIEKNVLGNNQYTNNSLKRVGQNDQAKPSAVIIADQLGVGEKTVRRASEFTLAVDRIVEVTGIRVNDILNGKITDPMDKVKELAGKEPELIKRIIEIVIANNDSIDLATFAVEKEIYDRQMKEAEERRRQVDKQLREKREAEEAAEKERIKKEQEEVGKLAKEALEKEKTEQERLEKLQNKNKDFIVIYNYKLNFFHKRSFVGIFV